MSARRKKAQESSEVQMKRFDQYLQEQGMDEGERKVTCELVGGTASLIHQCDLRYREFYAEGISLQQAQESFRALGENVTFQRFDQFKKGAVSRAIGQYLAFLQERGSTAPVQEKRDPEELEHQPGVRSFTRWLRMEQGVSRAQAEEVTQIILRLQNTLRDMGERRMLFGIRNRTRLRQDLDMLYRRELIPRAPEDDRVVWDALDLYVRYLTGEGLARFEARM